MEPLADPVEVKCNNVVLVFKKDGLGKGLKWDVPLNVGTNILEVRVKGTGKLGPVWRVSVDRAK